MTNDALAFVGHISANQAPVWLQEVQAIAGIATTIGVLIALYIAAIREPRKDAAERRHHAAQIDALRRAEQARIAAQARKVLPSCLRTPMFGETSWTVRIDNASDAVVTILGVGVAALDTNGIEVPHGCSRAAGTADPNYKLRITINYEDEAGYQWRRTDTSQPRRTDDTTQPATGTELWWRLD